MKSFHCTRALLLWCGLFGVIAAFLLRYGVLPETNPNGPYLIGLYERAKDSLFYQFIIVAFLGCVAYCIALIATLDRWIRAGDAPDRRKTPTAGWVARLVGLHRAGPGGGRDGRDIWPVGLYLAASPIRDAAVIFPAIGFIGTVIGVSLAIGGLNSVIETGDTAPLLDGLRIAFDTTLLGLVASVVLTMLLYLIQSRIVILKALKGLL